LLDLTGALLASLMSLPSALIYNMASIQVRSWILAVILLIGTSIQWWLVGYVLSFLWNQRNSKIPVK
ncbi:MAG TPA: hypothetical protein VG324_06610, partial [Blastocatellia bacterium]|nr:hypothetical protein [Blastocatellia bacterium]